MVDEISLLKDVQCQEIQDSYHYLEGNCSSEYLQKLWLESINSTRGEYFTVQKGLMTGQVNRRDDDDVIAMTMKI